MNNLFVPGRICLFGEHSDHMVNNGEAITYTLNLGIYSNFKKSKKIIIKNNNRIVFNHDCSLIDITKYDSHLQYILSAINEMISKYNVKGINLNIVKSTLPSKKSLSSSSAIILTIIKAFNILYNLNLTLKEEEELGVISERNIGSNCGLMDFISINEKGLVKLKFDYNNNVKEKINLKKQFNFLLVELPDEKNTKNILNLLHENKFNKNILNYYENEKNEIIQKAVDYLEKGLPENLGMLMNQVQNFYYENIYPLNDKEFNSSYIKNILEDSFIKNKIFGGKNTGSHGMGSLILLLKNSSDYTELINYITIKFGLNCHKIIMENNKLITKAVIPVGGHGTRMYPFTKVLSKEFLPVYINEFEAKPAILLTIEELIESGIEEIYMIVSNKNFLSYMEFYKDSSKIYNKKEENHLKHLFSYLRFVKDEHMGFPNVLKLIKNYIRNEDFLLVLGDQVYKSFETTSCTKQLLNFYQKNDFKLVVSTSKVDINKCSNYGVIIPKNDKDDRFDIDLFLEKPKIETLQNLKVLNEYCYTALGQYILPTTFLEILEEIKDFKNISITDIINKTCKVEKNVVFKVNGKFFDIGNWTDYKEAINYYKEQK